MINPAYLADMIRQSQERDRRRAASRDAESGREATPSMDLPRLPEQRRVADPVEEGVSAR
jgi:hypothetical protein